MKIIFVRHGQTHANAKKLIQGRIDNPLNAIGKKQAKKAGQLLKQNKIQFDYIVSSPLSRALETAQLIARKLNYKNEIYVEPQFVERDFKPHEMDTIENVFPIIINTNYKHPQYEDDAKLELRIKEAIRKLANKFRNKTIIVSAHAHVIRATYILANPKKYNYINHYLGNTSIHIFNVDKTNIKFISSLNNDPQ